MITVRLLLGAALFLIPCAPAFAQFPADLWLIFNPRIFDYKTFGNAGSDQYTSESVRGQNAEFNLAEYRLTVGGQPWHTEDRELLVLVNYRRFEIDSTATLPVSGLDIPDELENANVGVGYRRILEDNTIVGGLLQIGSASDEPFHSFEESYVGGNFFMRVPRNRHDGWLYLLNVDFNRDVPLLPGFAYQHRDTVYKMILGFPLTEIEYRPRENVTLEFSYVPINQMEASATYALSSVSNVFASFQWREFFFRRAARPENDAIIEYDERRIATGLRFDIDEHFSASIGGGYAFHRRFAEGDSLSARRHNDIHIRDALFMNGGIQYFFR